MNTWYRATRRKRSVFSTLPMMRTTRLVTKLTTCAPLTATWNVCKPACSQPLTSTDHARVVSSCKAQVLPGGTVI